jgi:cytochrome b pre-mRNA-processing protein 3
MRISPLRRNRRDAKIIASLYGAIVAQGRLPAFYESYGVADTVNGRFEMIVLHMVLALRRLNGGSADLRRLGQGVFDTFCSDMDANLRELGVGDLTVPRRMRGIGEAFYGRQSAYGAALTVDNCKLLAAALARNVFGSRAAGQAERLASYARLASLHLAAHDGAALRRGEIGFPDPQTVATAGAVSRETNQEPAR